MMAWKCFIVQICFQYRDKYETKYLFEDFAVSFCAAVKKKKGGVLLLKQHRGCSCIF
jgi:hypothetical protein